MKFRTLVVFMILGLIQAELLFAETEEQIRARARAEAQGRIEAEEAAQQRKEEREKARKQQEDAQAQAKENAEFVKAPFASATGGTAEKCKTILQTIKEKGQQYPALKNYPEAIECRHLEGISKANGYDQLEAVSPRESEKKSMDGQITCVMKASFTIDYEKCVKAINLYNVVEAADKAMELQQKVRTDLKNQEIGQEAQRKAAQGDAQTAQYDAAIANQNHMKAMNTEQVMAYGTAVAALVAGYNMIPTEKGAIKACIESNNGTMPALCPTTVKKSSNKALILANSDAKAALAAAIMKYTAKAAAAGIRMGINNKNVKAVSKAKEQVYDDLGTDLMVDRCAFNPADPACIALGNRVRRDGPNGIGDFSIGGDGNSFNLNPDAGEFGEQGAPTNIDSKQVGDINSPFKDDAKIAKGIMDPAGAAQTQATGGSGGGGGGGAGGGGGGASLGNDLDGKDPEADKEAQIKTQSISGKYDEASGGGYKGISKAGKDEANPFESLFDQKNSGGGVEEDRSIASEEISGKDSGLFQKISKRYGLIQADKRIEANNLE